MKILIALDESPVSARAAREAVRLFSLAGAHFLVINVAAIPTAWVGGLRLRCCGAARHRPKVVGDR
jgi:hydroxyethylthiazole kinase-like sugar kinase family protein